MDIGIARSAMAAATATVAVAITSAFAQTALMPADVVVAAAGLDPQPMHHEPGGRLASIELVFVNDQALLDQRYHDALYGAIV